MLSKKDLAKEFSLVVQQEIKNHNDMILATNQSLEEFRREIIETSNKSDKRHAKLEDYLTYLEIDIKKIENNACLNIKNLESKLQDIQSILEKKFTSLGQGIEKRESYFLTLQGFQDFQKKIDEWLANIRVLFEKQKCSFDDEIKKIYCAIDESIFSLKAKIEQKITDSIKKSEDIDSSLDIYAVNNAALKKEIDHLKKQNFILEKNIENIYTQIKRIKESK